jgi:hypothetical protein
VFAMAFHLLEIGLQLQLQFTFIRLCGQAFNNSLYQDGMYKGKSCIELKNVKYVHSKLECIFLLLYVTLTGFILQGDPDKNIFMGQCTGDPSR